MTKINDSNVTEWMERFLSGETSCAEEQELYRYFRKKNLPDNVVKYKEMMSWYASELDSGQTNTHKLKLRHYLYIAASVIIFISIGWTATNSIINYNNKISQYEGCYVIRNGEKIKDIDEVIASVEQMELMVAQQHAIIQKAKMSTGDIINRYIDEYYDDPATQQKILTIFEN